MRSKNGREKNKRKKRKRKGKEKEKERKRKKKRNEFLCRSILAGMKSMGAAPPSLFGFHPQ